MSCAKVATMPSGFPPYTIPTMSYHNGLWPQTVTKSSSGGSSSASSLLTPLSTVTRSSSHYSQSSASHFKNPPLSQRPYRPGTPNISPPPTSRNLASEIIPRLYISDLSFAENPALLRTYHITHILSILPESLSLPPDAELRLILGYTPVRLQIRDVEDFPFAELAAHLPTTTGFIQTAFKANPESRVLVHCVEGISRSVSVVAAFLMAQYGWTPMEAVGYVKEKRKIANPNFGFVKQLYEYGREALGKRGLIEGM
ncbi:MAG: protein-tyrosine phosphatase-like protein [Lentinula lateritia]|nr:MAG: protein-tyrosine phosphatase-like protein [Lentinula lateritia]